MKDYVKSLRILRKTQQKWKSQQWISSYRVISCFDLYSFPFLKCERSTGFQNKHLILYRPSLIPASHPRLASLLKWDLIYVCKQNLHSNTLLAFQTGIIYKEGATRYLRWRMFAWWKIELLEPVKHDGVLWLLKIIYYDLVKDTLKVREKIFKTKIHII